MIRALIISIDRTFLNILGIVLPGAAGMASLMEHVTRLLSFIALIISIAVGITVIAINISTRKKIRAETRKLEMEIKVDELILKPELDKNEAREAD